jgi:tetratricopeptide (TPR) repeat protein
MTLTAPSLAATSPEALMSAGLSHHNAGRLAEAEAAYRHVLAAHPDHPDALHLLGVIALQVGKAEVAVDLIRQAIRHNPSNPVFFANLTGALRRLGRTDEALDAGRQAMRLDDNFADGLNNLANVLLDAKVYGEAADVLKRLITLRPGLIDQRQTLARALILAGRAEEAVAVLRHYVQIAPREAQAAGYSNLGVALRKLERYEEAREAYQTALRIAPDDAAALNNYGTLLQDEDRYAEAEACFRKAIEANPRFADAHLNLSLVMRAEMRFDESMQAARAALALDPMHAEAHTSLSHGLLITGNLREGFAEYEWRSRIASFSSPRRTFPSPVWDGTSLSGQSILVHDEQGVGDALQFVRYAQQLHRRGARVIVECNTQLLTLFSALPDVDAVIGRTHPLPPHDAHISMLSLPHILGTEIATIPAEVPYLRVDSARVAAWRERLGPRRGLRVGFVWAGNPEFRADRARSIRLCLYHSLFKVEGVEAYVLQKGKGREEIATDGLPQGLIDIGPEIKDFADTAAIMLSLDLVISVDTATAHLAGALGKPVWLITRFDGCWRWFEQGETTPWYPTMRLFRQDRRGDWEPVMARVRMALEEAARERG